MKSLLAVLALTVTLAATIDSQSAPSGRGDDLMGIWGTQISFGPKLDGELNIRRGADGRWVGSVSTAEARASSGGDSVSLDFPGNLGAFRGRLGSAGRLIRGFWIQPAGVVVDYPFATPVTLERSAANTWQGTVAPLPARYSLYAAIRRTMAGTLVGVFRNPEFNNNARWLQYRITLVGDSVHFVECGESCNVENPDPGASRVSGALRSSRPTLVTGDRESISPDPDRRLHLWWPPLNRVLVLTPFPDSQALGLFPRLPIGTKYSYDAPPARRDGWATARASSVGFDESKLATLVQRIIDTLPTHPRAPLIHSLLIARQGKLVLEEYFYGHDRETTHDLRSAGKTFSSIMLGAAMMRGTRISPDTPLLSLLPAGAPYANPDPRKQRITLAHLMTHTSGLACDDNDASSPGNEDTMQQQKRAQPDYWRYTLDLPLINEPGAHYAYCSATMNLMSAALTSATRTWLPELFDETIARPLQFGRYHYNLSPTLEGYLGGGAYVRPRDLLKIGQTYLNGGVWNGTRIVPAAWVTASTMKRVEWPRRGENVSEGMDGYAWHLHTVTSGGREYKLYEANGNGGQLLMVVPDADLVVVVTAGNYQHGGVWSRFRGDLLPNAIIAAINSAR